jgi:hypothetical protein
MEKAALFDNLDLDVLRYLRDYPQVVKSSSAMAGASPGSVYAQVNGYDETCNRIVEEFRSQGEFDKFLHGEIANRQQTCRRAVTL